MRASRRASRSPRSRSCCRGARAGLEDIDRELRVVLSRGTSAAAARPRGESGVERPSSPLTLRGVGALDPPEPVDHRGRTLAARILKFLRSPSRVSPTYSASVAHDTLLWFSEPQTVSPVRGTRAARAATLQWRCSAPSIRSIVCRARAGRARALARTRRVRGIRAPARGAPRWTFYEGPRPPTARPARTIVLSRVFKDVYPRYKRCVATTSSAKGGWDCHGLPVRSRSTQSGYQQGGDRGVRDRRVQRALPPVGVRLRRGLEPADGADRVLVDLDDAYSHADGSYVESVWWALERIHAEGLLYEGHRSCVLSALRDRPVLARSRAGLRGRRRPHGLREASAGRQR